VLPYALDVFFRGWRSELDCIGDVVPVNLRKSRNKGRIGIPIRDVAEPAEVVYVQFEKNGFARFLFSHRKNKERKRK